MDAICTDLKEEYAALDAILGDLDESDWQRVTPFDGWTIKEEISHLAYFDRFARLSAADETAFNRKMAELLDHLDTFFETTLEDGLALSNPDLLQWWRTESRAMILAFERLNPKTRVPWHLPMSARSSATARLMETWAHGQDIVDTLGVRRPATDRLKNIAHLGVATFGWSFSCRGMAVPEDPVRVVLTAPSGSVWTWGPETAANKISGPAEDFCLVAAQRRHHLDTGLEITGKTAGEWMRVAQIFAGPPAEGPQPGTFPKGA